MRMHMFCALPFPHPPVNGMQVIDRSCCPTLKPTRMGKGREKGGVRGAGVRVPDLPGTRQSLTCYYSIQARTGSERFVLESPGARRGASLGFPFGRARARCTAQRPPCSISPPGPIKRP